MLKKIDITLDLHTTSDMESIKSAIKRGLAYGLDTKRITKPPFYNNLKIKDNNIDLKSNKVELMYQQYLTNCNLIEKDLSIIQQEETRKAFFGGVSTLLKLIETSIGNMPEEKAFALLHELHEEMNIFWKNLLK